MNKFELIKALKAQKKSLELKIANYSDDFHYPLSTIKGSLNETNKSINEEVYKGYQSFRKFCSLHPDLFLGFSVMYRNTDRIISIKSNDKKKCFSILLENTFDGCMQRSMVLLPYIFLKSENDFLIIRKNYIKAYKLKNLKDRIKTVDSYISNLSKERVDLVKKIKEMS
jgi:hypothetical protein